jgi:serine/threonine protein kinase
MGINYSIASLCLICREGSGVWCHDCGLHYCGTCFDVEHSHPSYATHTSTPRFTHWEIDWNEVTILDKLGEGHFGSVLKAKWRGQEVAVKRLVTQNLSKETLLDFVQEAEAMQYLNSIFHSL